MASKSHHWLVLSTVTGCRNGTAGAQRHHGVEGYFGCAQGLKTHALRQRRKDELPFEQGEVIAEADARTVAEGHIGHAWPRLFLSWYEAVGIKALWVHKVVWVAMQRIRAEHQQRPNGERIAPEVEGMNHLAVEKPHRRIEPHSVFEDLSDIGHGRQIRHTRLAPVQGRARLGQ